MIEHRIQKPRFYEEGESLKLEINDTVYATFKARVAISLVERWGMVQSEDGGEDSTGRFRMKLMDVEDVVDRAVSMTERMMQRFDEKGWLYTTPTYAEMEAEIKAREQEEEPA